MTLADLDIQPGNVRHVIYEWPPGERAGVISLRDAATGAVVAEADTRDRERWPSDAEHVRRDMARRWLAGVAAGSP